MEDQGWNPVDDRERELVEDGEEEIAVDLDIRADVEPSVSVVRFPKILNVFMPGLTGIT